MSKLVALMPVRNEDWCLEFSLSVALQWCDEIVCFLHACTDRSSDIAMRMATKTKCVTVVGTDKTDWDEMTHRQAMLEIARVKARECGGDGPGATHIALIDADEVLTANLIPHAQAWALRQTAAQPWRLELPLYNLRRGLQSYHSNGIWGERWTTAAFQDFPMLHWKGDQFHHREPFGATLQPWRPLQHGQGGIMHLWGASERRLRAKHALYKITERVRWPRKPVAEIDRYYNQAIYELGGRNGAWTFASTPASWWEYALPRLGELIEIDREPWQEKRCRELVVFHGREMFRGLDLFGVV